MYKWIGWKLESQDLKSEFAFSLFLKIVFSNLGKTHYNFKKKNYIHSGAAEQV